MQADNLRLQFFNMKKLNSILIAYLIIFSLKAQSTFNITLKTDFNNIEGIYHPIIELNKGRLISITHTKYLNKYNSGSHITMLSLECIT